MAGKKLGEISEVEISYEELGDVYDGFGFEKKADEMYSIAEEMKRKSSNGVI